MVRGRTGGMSERGSFSQMTGMRSGYLAGGVVVGQGTGEQRVCGVCFRCQALGCVQKERGKRRRCSHLPLPIHGRARRWP